MYIEIFLPIKGYEGLYEVSTLGNVRNARSKRVLKPRPNEKSGYLLVALYKNGIAKGHSIHRLVAERFLINPLNKPQVNHKNTIKTDNRASNLEWSTRSENIQHSWRTGLRENARKATIKTKSKPVIQYDLQGNFIAEYPSAHEASRQTGINRGSISSCCNGILKTTGKSKWQFKTI